MLYVLVCSNSNDFIFENSGTVAFSFDAVALALPIEEEMKHKQHYPFILIGFGFF